MSQSSFIKASHSFSEGLSRIPQDNLPADLVNEANRILDAMRRDPGRITFGIPKGEQFLPHESNLAFGLSSLWQEQWNRQNPEKALWIDMYMTAEEESPNLHKSFDYEEERDRFIALQMAKLLRDQKQRIPEEIKAFLGIRRRGSKEEE
ncbi:MAG: hypothetical protein ACD_51C00143G0002 [uncultured bacterium]|uniref:Uncharacterized protein n=1 Tax=Candidatus Gottesmanbacteria bacterium RIFCSPLOWO2_01_FULL_43_11b TaxID=1798392 RepID=A0A1F6AGE8_9BACT|nr:MAG: hypothetical protein ACD_51C00143G0002 [uncultured bacterium]OGG23751.1 MAG: hypothetical protein A3A79_00905 [Candidatus Gottesmanbacteria bacterium RIFCSPLOWO2_01_FULL_43_11b]